MGIEPHTVGKFDPFFGRPLIVGGVWAFATVGAICMNVGLTGLLCGRLLYHTSSSMPAPWLFRATVWLGNHSLVLHAAVIAVYAGLLGGLSKKGRLRESFFVVSWGLLLMTLLLQAILHFAGYIILQVYGQA